MRLSDSEISQILAALGPHLQEVQARLMLFGSRVNDSLRGGDIDLALVVFNADDFHRLSRDSYKLLASIKMHLECDERIDLLVTTPERREADPFQKMALASAIELCSWPQDERLGQSV